MGGGRAAPAPSSWPPELGSACCASPSARPSGFTPLIEKYKKEIENAEPVGDYVNNNVMITTQMLCLEDGGRARKTLRSRSTPTYHLSLVFRYLDTFPRPPGIPEWPDLIPASTPSRSTKNIESGVIAVGDPDEVARRSSASPTPAPTS